MVDAAMVMFFTGSLVLLYWIETSTRSQFKTAINHQDIPTTALLTAVIGATVSIWLVAFANTPANSIVEWLSFPIDRHLLLTIGFVPILAMALLWGKLIWKQNQQVIQYRRSEAHRIQP